MPSHMKKGIANLTFENLERLQRFDRTKIRYDNESMVTKALHDAAEYAMSSDAAIYRDGSPRTTGNRQQATYANR